MKTPFAIVDYSWRIYHQSMGHTTARLLFREREGHDPLTVKEFGVWLYVGPVDMDIDEVMEDEIKNSSG